MTIEDLYWNVSNITDETQVYIFEGCDFKANASMKYLLATGAYTEDTIRYVNIKIFIEGKIMAMEIYF